MSEVVKTINSVLSKYGVTEQITPEDITVTDVTVSDSAKGKQKLSDCIIEKIWKHVPSATVYHFTSRKNAEAIINSRIFRLQNIGMRIKEDEISTFCKAHRLSDGYPEIVTPDIYFASFATTPLNESEQEPLWRMFAPFDGVRITLEVEASNHNFRRMRYQNNPDEPVQLLADLAGSIMQNHNRHFILTGISRMCAFYLPGSSYACEHEMRMLYKRVDDFGPQPIGTGPLSYIEVPIGIDNGTGYNIRIVEACSTTCPSMPSSIRFTHRPSRDLTSQR